MILACCFALSPLVGVPADLRGTLSFSDRSQATLHPANIRPGDAVDLSTTPAVQLDLAEHRSSYSAGYSPQFTWLDVGSSTEDFILLHTGRLGYSYSWRHTRFGLTETATLGTQNLTALTFLAPGPTATPPAGTTQPGPTQPGAQPAPMPAPMPAPTQTTPGFLPQQSTVRVFSEATTASIDTNLDRRTALGFAASYAITGGLGEEDQRVLPQQRTETALASLRYLLSTRDSLITNVSASHTYVITVGLEYWLLIETEGWTHSFNRELTGTFGVGVAEAWSRSNDGWSFSVSPAAIASLNGALYSYRRRNFSVALTFGLSLAPAVNALTGDLQETLGGGLALTVVKDRTTVTGTAGASQTFPVNADNAVRLVGVGVIATHHLTKLVDLFAGYSTAIQVSSRSSLSPPVPWNAFVGFAVRAPPLRF